MYFVNESFHNKALSGIVVYVSCSCALNLLNICTFTPHIRQTLATFPVIQFPPQLVHLVKICKFLFLSIRCTRCSIVFNINVPWIICWWPNHKNSHINISDTHKSLWKTKKTALPDSKFYIQFSKHNDYSCLGVGEKLNIRKRRNKRVGSVL